MVERDRLIGERVQEKGVERWRRLAKEYEELYGQIGEAEQYMFKVVESAEGDPERLMEMGKFYLR